MRIDFDRYIAERTRDASPRPWIFEKIAGWLADPGPSRYLLISAEPGGGKTVIAAQVCNASHGIASGDSGAIEAGSIAAHHFCFSKDAAWLDGLQFSHSIAAQLASSVPGFEEVRAATQFHGERIHAAANIQVGEVGPGGSVVGVELLVQLASPQATFTSVVRAPLERLYSEGIDRDVVILVDALDEARLAGSADTIFDLVARCSECPPRVRFLLTSRPDLDIIRTLERQDPHLVHVSLSDGAARLESRRDILHHVARALPKIPGIAGRIAPGLNLAALGEQLAEKAEGNFLWTRFALSMLAESQQEITYATLAALPAGLRPLYLELLERVASRDRARWRTEHAKVLGTLAVAQEEMPAAQLARYSELGSAEIAAVVKDLRQLLDAAAADGVPRYSLYHRSLADFLIDADAAQEYACDEREQHRRMVDVWSRSAEPDQYALRNVAVHLFALRFDPEMRRRLYGLASREWMRAKREALASDASFASDVALVAEAAAEEPADFLIEVRATSILTALRSRAASIPSSALALLARLGEMDRVHAYLALPHAPRAKVLAASRVAEALMDRDPVEAERLLREVVVAAPSEAVSTGARALRALALARLGQFEDVVPLLGAAVKQTLLAEQLATLAIPAGRLDIVDALLAQIDPRAMWILPSVVDALAEHGFFGAARRRIATLPESDRVFALEKLALALARDDRLAAIDTAAAISDELARIQTCARIVVSAARESERSLNDALSRLPPDESAHIVLSAVDLVATQAAFDDARRIAVAAGVRPALDLVDSKEIARLVEAGDLAAAESLIERARHDRRDGLRQALLGACAEHADLDTLVAQIRAADPSREQFGALLVSIARSRSPSRVAGVLRALPGRATPSMRRVVVEALVESGQTAVAFDLAESVDEKPVWCGLLDAAVRVDDVELAWRVWESTSDDLDDYDRIVAMLLSYGSLDRALRMLQETPDCVSPDARLRVIDVLTRSRRFDEAIAATRDPTRSPSSFLQRVLVSAPSDAVEEIVAAIHRDTRSIWYVGVLAMRELAARNETGKAKRVAAALRVHELPGEQLLEQFAIELFERGEADEACRLLESIPADGEPRIDHEEPLQIIQHLARAGAIREAFEWADRKPFKAFRPVLLAAMAEALPPDKMYHAVSNLREVRSEAGLDDANRVHLRARVALALHVLGETQRAAAMAKSALELARESSVIWSRDLSLALARTGFAAEAIERAEAVSRDFDGLVAVIEELATHGHAAEARAALRRAIVTLSPATGATADVTTVARTAIRILPAEDAAAELRPVASAIDFPLLFDALLHGTGARTVAEVVRAFAVRGYDIREGVARSIRWLTAAGQWDAAMMLVASAPGDRGEFLRALFRAASVDQRLGEAVAAARAASFAETDDVLVSLIAPGEEIPLQAQAAQLVGGATFDRDALIDALIRRRAFLDAARVAGGSVNEFARTHAVADVVVAAAKAGEIFGADLTDEQRDAAAGELLELGLYEEARAYARGISEWLRQATIADRLAAKGQLDLALDMAAEAGLMRETMLTGIAAAHAAVDPSRAMHVASRLRYGGRASAESGVVVRLIRSDRAAAGLAIMAEAVDLPHSLHALTDVARALLDVGREEEARDMIHRALELVDAIEDVRERNETLGSLAAAIANRGRIAAAIELGDGIPADSPFYSLAVVKIARACIRAGETAMVPELVKHGLDSVRGFTVAAAANREAELLALAIAAGGRRAFRSALYDVFGAWRASPSLDVRVLTALARMLIEHPSFRPEPSLRLLRPVRSAILRWRARRRALVVLDAACEGALRRGSETDARALAEAAELYAILARRRLAIKLARRAADAAGAISPRRAKGSLDVRSQPLRMSILATAAAALQAAGAQEEARLVASSVSLVQFVHSSNDEVLFATEDAGKLLAATGLAELDAVVKRAVSEPTWLRGQLFLRVAVAAAQAEPRYAVEVGRALSARAGEVGPDRLHEFARAIATCAELARDELLLRQATDLLLRMDAEKAAEVVSDLAASAVPASPSAAQEVLEVGLRIIGASDDPAFRSTQRAKLSASLRKAESFGEAELQLKLSLAESRNATRAAFFAVLGDIVRTADVDDDCDLLDGLATILHDTEQWWPHRRTAD